MNIKKLAKSILADKPTVDWEKGTRDEVGEFWVITKPEKDSIIQDILFKSDIHGMANQFRGGLKPDDIVGIIKSDTKAKAFAEGTLRRFKKGLIE